MFGYIQRLKTVPAGGQRQLRTRDRVAQHYLRSTYSGGVPRMCILLCNAPANTRLPKASKKSDCMLHIINFQKPSYKNSNFEKKNRLKLL